MRTYIPKSERLETYKRHGGKGGKHYGSFDHGRFIAWDGEGANIDGTHCYILLRCSSGDYISNTTSGLSTSECLRFITTIAKQNDRRAIHVCYGASYDVNMMLRDVPRELIWKLWTTGRCIWTDKNEHVWMLEYRQRKQFTIRELPRVGWKSKDKKGVVRWNFIYSVTLWDVVGFFQCPFVEAIKEYLLDYDQSILTIITQQKEKRCTFTINTIKQINDYCGLEIDALVQIMGKVREAMITAGFKVKRWDGAGAVAEALLTRESVKAYQNKSIPSDVKKAAWTAYAGGRIEVLQYGRFVGPVWHYDINSAYPTAACTLPSLDSMASFVETTQFSSDLFALWHVSWDFDRTNGAVPFYPFFFRSQDGSICYPAYGSGWYWTPEVNAALAFDRSGVTIDYGYALVDTRGHGTDNAYQRSGNDAHDPFAFIPSLYNARLNFKREGNAAQKIIKLGMNSIYGKLAQQIGGKTYYDEEAQKWIKKEPAFQQIEWAGYITSLTRAKLFTAGQQNQQNIIMFSTDGIFSSTPLDLPLGAGLGDWELNVHDELIVAQSGVYWYRDGDVWHDKYRGFDKTLSREDVLNAWYNRRTFVMAPSTRFVTLGQALSGENPWKEWRTWKEKDRRLSLIAHGTKRHDLWDATGQPPAEWQPHLAPVRTLPLHCEDAYLGLESAIYKQEPEAVEERLEMVSIEESQS